MFVMSQQSDAVHNSRWYIDSGCSRHMTGDFSMLSEVKDYNGGYVAFAGDKGGVITGQGTLTNGQVSFEKVNFVEQLNHNLLSVSQVCYKKVHYCFY